MKLDRNQTINGYNVFELTKKLLGNEIYYISPLNEINISTVTTVELDRESLVDGMYFNSSDIPVYIKTLNNKIFSLQDFNVVFFLNQEKAIEQRLVNNQGLFVCERKCICFNGNVLSNKENYEIEFANGTKRTGIFMVSLFNVRFLTLEGECFLWEELKKNVVNLEIRKGEIE